MDIHEVLEGLQTQSADEEIVWSDDVTLAGGSPSSVSVKAYDEKTGSDVTSAVFPVNSPTVSGNLIILSPLKALTALHIYRIEIKFTSNGQKLEDFFRVQCVF